MGVKKGGPAGDFVRSGLAKAARCT